jgi:hypothetical protein
LATGNITASSDSRLKDKLETITNAIEKVSKITGYTYERTDMEDNKRHAGVIAQEVLEVLPEVVQGGPTEENPDGTYSVAYGNLSALLIEAIKEQQKQINEIKEQINTVKSQE